MLYVVLQTGHLPQDREPSNPFLSMIFCLRVFAILVIAWSELHSLYALVFLTVTACSCYVSVLIWITWFSFLLLFAPLLCLRPLKTKTKLINLASLVFSTPFLYPSHKEIIWWCVCNTISLRNISSSPFPSPSFLGDLYYCLSVSSFTKAHFLEWIHGFCFVVLPCPWLWALSFQSSLFKLPYAWMSSSPAFRTASKNNN